MTRITTSNAAVTTASAVIGTPTPARKTRRMAREPKQGVASEDSTASYSGSDIAPEPVSQSKQDKALSKLDQVEALLLAATGASIAELVAATGWQQHSVRGAMAGALKKRGLVITSDKADGVRHYRASKGQ